MGVFKFSGWHDCPLCRRSTPTKVISFQRRGLGKTKTIHRTVLRENFRDYFDLEITRIDFFLNNFHINVNGGEGGEQVTKGFINIQFSR